MTYILRLDTSPRHANSESRSLADKIEQHLMSLKPSLGVKARDLSSSGLPHIANDTIAGFYSAPGDMTEGLIKATALSDELIAELKDADTLLISAPMYNFGVPSSLKAWIDQIVRINATFSFDGANFEGLVPVNRAVLALAYGANGYAPGGDFAAMNFLEPYLVSLMGFLGIGDTRVIRIQGTTGDPEDVATARELAAKQISTLYVGEVSQ